MENAPAPKKRGRPPKVKESPLDALKPLPEEIQKVSPLEYPAHIAPAKKDELSFAPRPTLATVASAPVPAADLTVPIIGEAEAAAIWADVAAREPGETVSVAGAAAVAWVDGEDGAVLEETPKPKRGRPKGKSKPVLEEVIPAGEPFDPSAVRARLAAVPTTEKHEPFPDGVPVEIPMFEPTAEEIEATLKREANSFLVKIQKEGPQFLPVPEPVYWKLHAVHSSDVKLAFEKSALHLEARDQLDSAALKLGRAFHARMEGKPIPEGTSKADAARVETMAQRASAHPVVSHAIKAAVGRPEDVEATGIVWDEEFGIFRCIRADVLLPNHGIILDWKTTSDASESGFAKSAANYGYFIQAAYYLDTANMIRAGRPGVYPMEFDSFLMVAVESKSPHDVQVFEVPHVGIELGRDQYRKGLARISEARKNGAKGYSTEIKPLVPPAWLFYK